MTNQILMYKILNRNQKSENYHCHREERSKKILSSFQRFAPCEIKDFLRGSRGRRGDPVAITENEQRRTVLLYFL